MAFASKLLVAAAAASAAAYRNAVIRKNVEPVITQPLPHTYIDVGALPTDFDWRNINNISFVTQNLNQHIPKCECAGLRGIMPGCSACARGGEQAQRFVAALALKPFSHSCVRTRISRPQLLAALADCGSCECELPPQQLTICPQVYMIRS